MSLATAKFERALDRLAPPLLLVLGLASAAAMVIVGA
jgi:hypothetical protein